MWISPQRFCLQQRNKTAQTRKSLRCQILLGERAVFTHLSQFQTDQVGCLVCVSLTCETCRFRDLKKPEKWRIITDAGLMKISSFPHFFHGDYCVSQVRETHFSDSFSIPFYFSNHNRTKCFQDIQWAPDNDESVSTFCVFFFRQAHTRQVCSSFYCA